MRSRPHPPGNSRTLQPLVLMYHGVPSPDAPPPPRREPGAERYDVPVDLFRRHLERLRRDPPLTVGTLPSAAGEAPPQVVLTFDDGEENLFRNALPLLLEHGFSAYFFVSAAFVGTPGYLDRKAVSALAAAGMTVGSHGLTHQDLTQMDDTSQRHELVESRRRLEALLDREVTDLSAPQGFFDRRVLLAARAAGYRRLFTSSPRDTADGVFGRAPVRSNWTPARFDLALQGRQPATALFFEFAKALGRGLFGTGAYCRLRSRLLKKPRE